MKKLMYLMSLLLLAVFSSCEKESLPDEGSEEKPEVTRDLAVEEFIYSVMNEIYLYKADVPELADSYFDSQQDRSQFLASFETPEDLFDGLQAPQDRFSYMTDDYEALEERVIGGIEGTTGMDFILSKFSNSDMVYGVVRYVLPGSSAAEQGVKRGDVFTEVNGVPMDVDNYRELLSGASFSIRIAEVENSVVKQTDKIVELVKEELSENPVHTKNVIDLSGHKIGYLFYNRFTPDYVKHVNDAFGEFKAAGITDLVIDLRYNPGGEIETARDFASMITGQFNNQVLLKLQFNQDYQEYFEENAPEQLVSRFDSKISTGEQINSLNLQKVYIIGTGSTASASELVMHCLSPYIDVVHIGTPTVGKFEGSWLLYDSPNFLRTDDQGNVHVNPDHKYALQPIVFKFLDKNDESGSVDGLIPDVEIREDLNNFGVLGDPNEPFFAKAIELITGVQQKIQLRGKDTAPMEIDPIFESDAFYPDYQRTYVKDIPLKMRRN